MTAAGAISQPAVIQISALRRGNCWHCELLRTSDVMSRPNIDRAVAYVRRLHVKHDGGFGYMVGHGSTVTRAGGIALEVCGEHRTEETLSAAKMILSRPLTKGRTLFLLRRVLLHGGYVQSRR